MRRKGEMREGGERGEGRGEGRREGSYERRERGGVRGCDEYKKRPYLQMLSGSFKHSSRSKKWMGPCQKTLIVLANHSAEQHSPSSQKSIPPLCTFI